MQFLGVSEGQMQMGHMRFEPNINVHITDQDGKVHKTAITEIKNLNSFSVLERATAYEVQRQIHAVGRDRLARQKEHLRLGRADRKHLLAARQGRSQRLPLFPRSGSGAGGSGRCLAERDPSADRRIARRPAQAIYRGPARRGGARRSTRSPAIARSAISSMPSSPPAPSRSRR